jgi:hypothetical protein
MGKNNTPTAIRLSVTDEVRRALYIAKKRYPALSDPEILKLGLSKIITDDAIYIQERDEIRAASAGAVGRDYLADQEEDLYSSANGTKVHFA